MRGRSLFSAQNGSRRDSGAGRATFPSHRRSELLHLGGMSAPLFREALQHPDEHRFRRAAWAVLLIGRRRLTPWPRYPISNFAGA
jgi:hypothetical protein